MPRASPSPFVCTECGRSFCRKHDLNRHALTHEADATRYYCAFPDCDYSSLQKSNLKTHFSSKHLRQKPHRCNIDGCPRSYGDPSALLRHEKKDHSYYRKEHKPYDRPSPKKLGGHFDLDDSIFIKGAARTPASSTPSLYESNGAAPSPASPSFPSTPFATSSVSLSAQTRPDLPYDPEFLSEMLLELFEGPETSRNIPASPPYSSNHGLGDAFEYPTTPQVYLDLQMPKFEDFAPVNDVFTLKFWSLWASLA